MRHHFYRRHTRARRRAVTLLAALGAASLTGCVQLAGDAARPFFQDADLVMHTTLSAGARSTDVDTSLGDSEQAVVGLEVDWYDTDAPLGVEVGYLFSHETHVDFHEGYLGLRRTWDGGAVTPYVGGGASYFTVNPDRASDFGSWGGYVHAGAYWPLATEGTFIGMPMTIGFDVRSMAGEHASALEARVFLGFANP